MYSTLSAGRSTSMMCFSSSAPCSSESETAQQLKPLLKASGRRLLFCTPPQEHTEARGRIHLNHAGSCPTSHGDPIPCCRAGLIELHAHLHPLVEQFAPRRDLLQGDGAPPE